MSIEIILIVSTILIATLFPFAAYLTIRFGEKVSKLRNSLGELHMLYHEVSQLNDKLVRHYKSKGIELEKAPKEPPYKELGS